MGKGDRKEAGDKLPKYGRGQHPNSRKNLEQGMAKPGEVLNPNGKPPGTKDRSTILNKWLTAECDITNPITRLKQKGTVEDEVILALITKARKGDVAAIKEIQDTLYGKLKDKTEHSFDFSNLSDEEVTQLAGIISKLNS